MTSALVQLYATHVIEGKRTIESVPEKFRDEVKEIVETEAETEVEAEKIKELEKTIDM